MIDPAQTTVDQPIDPADAQLVAYLDNELDDDERHEIEQRLLEEDGLRERLKHLQQTFDMLDELPSVKVDRSFTRSTVEMVALSASQAIEIQQRQRPWRIATFSIAGGVAAVLLALLSYSIVRNDQSTSNEQQLADLGVVQNLDGHLREVPAEYLRRLSTDSTWQMHVSRGVTLGELSLIDSTRDLATFPKEARLTMASRFPPEAAQELKSGWERFRNLSEEEKEVVRAHSDYLQQQPDAETLHETLTAYSAWLGTISASERAAISDAESEQEWLRRVYNAIDAQWEIWSKIEGQDLPPEDIEPIVQWLATIAQDRFEKLPEDNAYREHLQQRSDWLRARSENWYENNPEFSPPPTWVHMTWDIVKRHEGDREGIDTLIRAFRGGDVFPGIEIESTQRNLGVYREAALQFLTPTEEERNALIQSLSKEARDYLEELDEEARISVLDGWAHFANKANVQRLFFGELPTRREIYLELPPEQKERVDLMTPDEFNNFLRERQHGERSWGDGSRGSSGRRSEGRREGRNGAGRRFRPPPSNPDDPNAPAAPEPEPDQSRQ